MKTKCMTFPLNAARVVAALAVLSGASSAVAGSKVADFEIGDGQTPARLSDLRGRFVVIQILPSIESPGVAEYMQGFSRRRSALADWVPILVCPVSEETVQTFRAKRSSVSPELRVCADVNGAIAKSLGLVIDATNPGPIPATIIVDPAGTEVFRRVGKSADDLMPTQDVFSFVESRSVSPDFAQFNLEKGEPALQGYDPVAYFESESPMKGRSEWTTKSRGVTYQFASESNLRKFLADPERFHPTYGGWCATAMAEGRKVDIDPTNFKVTQGRLFLFYKGWLGNARNDWDKKEAELMRLADEQWRRIAPSDHALERN